MSLDATRQFVPLNIKQTVFHRNSSAQSEGEKKEVAFKCFYCYSVCCAAVCFLHGEFTLEPAQLSRLPRCFLCRHFFFFFFSWSSRCRSKHDTAGLRLTLPIMHRVQGSTPFPVHLKESRDGSCGAEGSRAVETNSGGKVSSTISS